MIPLENAVWTFTRAYLRTLMVGEGGNITRAAKRAGRARTDFYRMLKKHDLDQRDFRMSSRELIVSRMSPINNSST